MAGNVLEITKENWEAEVANSSLPVLVDFWAEWCGPCRAIGPIVEELGTELEGKLKVAKVNVDEAPELANEYGVRSIPTLILFKDGTPEEQMVGAMSKAALTGKLEPHLS